MKVLTVVIISATLLITAGFKTTQKQTNMTQTDNSKKTILARGCDPILSRKFAEIAPSMLNNVTYIPTTNDSDFFEKLKNEKWSVVYFAPGACRYSNAKQRIPGSVDSTKSWSLEEYHNFIYQHQGKDVIIVETPYESESLELLKAGLKKAREVK